MKRFVILIVAFFCLSFSLTSRAQDLSAEGKGHFIAAQRLFEMANFVNDYVLIAEEFESVAKTDPSFAKTYINLCLVYSRIGAEQGEPYFSKAEAALERYKKLAPEDTDGYTEEAISLKAMRRKYEDGLIKRKTGDWYITEGEGNAICPNHISISAVSPYEMVFDYPSNSWFSSRTISQNMDLSKNNIKLTLMYNSDSGRFMVGKGDGGGAEIFYRLPNGSWESTVAVGGYYDAYKVSKIAVKEVHKVEYTISFEGDRLVFQWLLKSDYLDESGRKLFFWKSLTPTKVVFNKR